MILILNFQYFVLDYSDYFFISLFQMFLFFILYFRYFFVMFFNASFSYYAILLFQCISIDINGAKYKNIIKERSHKKENHTISQKMNQMKKSTYKSIITPITTNDKQLIFGISFIDPPDLLTLYKQHFYSLFLLIYFYGESEHISRTIGKLKNCQKKIEQKLQNHYLKCISKNEEHDESQCQQKIKYDHQIKVLQFMQAQLSKNKCTVDRYKNANKQIFHNLLQRQLIRKSFIMLFEEQKKLSRSSILTLNDFSKLAGSVLDIQITLKSYWNIQIVQFNCQEFKDKNIQVFIEINKSQKKYQYIKKYDFGMQNYSKNNQCGEFDTNKSLNNTLEENEEFSNSAFYLILRREESFMAQCQDSQSGDKDVMDEEKSTDSRIIEQQNQTNSQEMSQQQSEKNFQQEAVALSFQSSMIIKKSKQPIYKKNIQNLHSPSPKPLKQQSQEKDKEQLLETHEIKNPAPIINGTETQMSMMTVSSLQFQFEKQYKKARRPSQQILVNEVNFQKGDRDQLYQLGLENDKLFSGQSTKNNKQISNSQKKCQQTKKEAKNTKSMSIPKTSNKKKQRKRSQEVKKTGFQNILEQNSDTQPVQISKMEDQIKKQKINEEQQREWRKKNKKQNIQKKISLSQHSLNISTSLILHRVLDAQQFNQDLDEQIFKFESQIKNQDDHKENKFMNSELLLQEFAELLQNISKQKILQYQRILNEIEKTQNKDGQQIKTSTFIKTIINKTIQQNIYKHLTRIQYIRKKIQLKKRSFQGNSANPPNLNSQHQKNKYNLRKRGQQMIKFPQKIPQSNETKVKNLTKSILLQKGANFKQIISQECSRNHIKNYEQKIDNYETQNSQISLKSAQLRSKQKQLWNQIENEDYMGKSKIMVSKMSEVLKDGERNGGIFQEYDMSKSKILEMSEYSPSKKVKQAYQKFQIKNEMKITDL